MDKTEWRQMQWQIAGFVAESLHEAPNHARLMRAGYSTPTGRQALCPFAHISSALTLIFCKSSPMAAPARHNINGNNKRMRRNFPFHEKNANRYLP
jgi:hypothetical protein